MECFGAACQAQATSSLMNLNSKNIIDRDILTMLSQILFAAFAATAAASSGFLEETSNSTICDSVKQYSGYYKLTTGAK